jgi:hypothetical protein
MRALKKLLTTRHAFVAESFAWTLPGEGASVRTSANEAAAKSEASVGTHVKNIALFVAAPFVGLAYIMAFPLVGLCMLAWLAGKKLIANKTARPIVLALAAPFATIAFVIAAPVAGLGALAWIGGRALLKA